MRFPALDRLLDALTTAPCAVSLEEIRVALSQAFPN